MTASAAAAAKQQLSADVTWIASMCRFVKIIHDTRKYYVTMLLRSVSLHRKMKSTVLCLNVVSAV